MTDRKKAEIICSEIREYMSRFIDTDEKVVDMLCDIVSENLIKEKTDEKERFQKFLEISE